MAEFGRLVRARFPDLCVFEDAADRSHVRFYDAFEDADEEVMFCEERPAWLREIEAREGRRTRMDEFLFRQDETPWLWLQLTPVQEGEFMQVGGDGTVKRLGRDIRYLMPVNLVQHEGRLWGAYPKDDKQAERFFNAVFGIAERFMTNSFEWYRLDEGGREYAYTEVGSKYWTGPDTIRISGEDDDFYPLIRMDAGDDGWYAAKAIPRITGMGRGRKKLR